MTRRTGAERTALGGDDTATPVAPDLDADVSYSVHECRCGAPMRRTTDGRSPWGWFCPGCGRHERR